MDGFLMKEPARLADPDGITDPVCLTQLAWRTRRRRASAQAAEALAVISSTVAVGLGAALV